ncbi:hypothetical protein E1287_29010, partial [Actinomadura sp. KC06]
MDDDAQQKPVTSGSKKQRADEEHESARAATAEFRIPENVSLTRPDISIRRPAPEPENDEDDAGDDASDRDDDASEEPAPAPPQGPWYVHLPKPAAEDDGAENAEAPEDVPPETPSAPESGGAGPTRVEALPVLSRPSQNAPPQLPAVQSSGQWTVPWDGSAPMPTPA